MYFKGTELINIGEFLLEQLCECSLQELRLICSYLSKINSLDESTAFVLMPVEEYCKRYGIEKPKSDYLRYLEQSIDKLTEISITGRDPDKGIMYAKVHLFPDACLYREDGKDYIAFAPSPNAIPLLFNLKSYIQARGCFVENLNSPNQILLYFMLKKQEYCKKPVFEVPVDKLRRRLGVKTNEYIRFGDFRMRVLNACQKALSEYTDISFTYERGKTGARGKWETVVFHIKENRHVIKRHEVLQIPETSITQESEVSEAILITELCEKNLNRKLCEIEKDWIRTWVNDYGMTEVLVKRAFEDNMFRSHLTLKNVNDTLTKWHEHGIRTLEAAEKFCKEEHNANIRKAAKKSSISGAKWKTGAESGLFYSRTLSEKTDGTVEEEPSKPEKAEKAADNEKNKKDDGGIPGDILDMFGD